MDEIKKVSLQELIKANAIWFRTYKPDEFGWRSVDLADEIEDKMEEFAKEHELRNELVLVEADNGVNFLAYAIWPKGADKWNF